MSDAPKIRRTHQHGVWGLLTVFCAIASVACETPWSLEPSSVNANRGAHAELQARFEDEVLPLLETRCAAGCHGVDALAYDAFIEDPLNQVGLFFPVDRQTGRVPKDPEARRRTYEVMTGAWPKGGEDEEHGAGGGHRIDYEAEVDYSPLLRAPLAESVGGLPHRGIDVFATTEDPDYQILREWIVAQRKTHEPKAWHKHAGERLFEEQVVGVLERNGCFLISCHGPNVFNDLKLTTPLPRLEPGDPPRLSPQMLRANREVVLGAVNRMVNLGGDLKLSRLIVKNLPIEEGGVHQRGGNVQFFESYDDPDVALLLEWMEAEREVLAARLRSRGEPIDPASLGRSQGVAFLRGPRHAPRTFFDGDSFWPGTRLMILPEGGDAPVEIAGGPTVEIQAFDVRYDARAIVLSMRTGADQGFRLYEIELDDQLRPMSRSPRLISGGPDRLDHLDGPGQGALIHHLDPIYSPGPDDAAGVVLDDVAVTFASNAAGEYVNSDAWALVGEADAGSDLSTLVDLQRVEAAGTFSGRRLHVLDGPMRGQWRRIDEHGPGGRLVLDSPLPATPDTSTIYAIEREAADYRSAYDIWRVVPGRIFMDSARRVTFTSSQERRPSMRTSGEVMFTSVRNRGWQGDRPVFNGAIFRVMAGGFDYHIQGGNRSRYPLYADSRELPQALELRLLLDPRNHWGGGALVLADHGFGVNLEPDNPMDTIAYASGDPRLTMASQRFLPTHLSLLPELGEQAVTHTGVSPGGSFRDPYPLPDGTVLVAHTPASLDHLDPAADPDWDVYRLRFDGPLQSVDGTEAGEIALERLDSASSESWSEFNPRPIVVRLKEKTRPHQKFTKAAAARGPALSEGVLRAPDDSAAEVECYDYPLLSSFLTSFTPIGARDFRDQELRYVRIVRQIPPTYEETRVVTPPTDPVDHDPFATAVSMGVHTRQEIVAEIPLEADGSFYARVPTEVPLIVQGLDSQRRAVHSMNRWFYVQPGEKLTFSIPRKIYSMRCAGCHAALTGDRADALGRPDVITAASRVMATWNAVEARRRPAHVQPPISIDFQRDVQPMLDAKCVRCHDSEESPAGLDLRGDALGAYSVAYVALHALDDPGSGDHSRKRWINEREGLSSQSPLVELLIEQGHPVEDPLSEYERLTIIRWIDLGATFLGGPR